MIQTQVGHDAVNPGVKGALETEVADIAVCLEERFLVNVLSVLLGSGHVIRQTQHCTVVLAYQFLKRGMVPALGFPDQLRVVHSALGLLRYASSFRGGCGRLRARPPRWVDKAKTRAYRESNCTCFSRHAGFRP